LAWHPGGGVAYVNEESGGVITAYRWDGAVGALSPFQTLPTGPDGFDPSGVASAEVAVGPSGRHLYVANRGPPTIATFAIEGDGRLRAAGQTRTPANPRHFTFNSAAGGGTWMLCSGGDRVTGFKLDADGVPQAAAEELGAPCPSSAHLLFGREHDASRL
jgi:6-phosphogluconolactonase (cycloisomerase 2 family)